MTEKTCKEYGSRITIPVILIALLVSVTGISAVYAEQQVLVGLPIDRPFDTTECQAWTVIQNANTHKFLFSCMWEWTLDQSIAPTLNELDVKLTEGKNYTTWLEEVIPLVEANPYIEPKSPAKAVKPDKKDSSVPADVSEIDKKILDDFEKCFGGQQQAFAFQQEYEFEKFVRKFLRSIDSQDKLAEECIAIGHILNYSNTAYPGLVVREDTSSKTIVPELKMSAGIQVTDEKKQEIANAIVYPPLYKNPYGDCVPMDETDKRCENRGSSTPKVTDNAYMGFKDMNKTASQILDEYEKKKAADILTRQDIKNLNKELNTMVCEIAWNTSGNGGLHISKWRTFLADGWCNDKLEPQWFRDEYRSLEEIIELKLEQTKTETKQDLRTYK